jgi:hypothetical protein
LDIDKKPQQVLSLRSPIHDKRGWRWLIVLSFKGTKASLRLIGLISGCISLLIASCVLGCSACVVALSLSLEFMTIKRGVWVFGDTEKHVSFIFRSRVSLLVHWINLTVVTIHKVLRPILKQSCIDVLIYSPPSAILGIPGIQGASDIAWLSRIALSSCPIIDLNFIGRIAVITRLRRYPTNRSLVTLINHLGESTDLLHRSQDSPPNWHCCMRYRHSFHRGFNMRDLHHTEILIREGIFLLSKKRDSLIRLDVPTLET